MIIVRCLEEVLEMCFNELSLPFLSMEAADLGVVVVSESCALQILR